MVMILWSDKPDVKLTATPLTAEPGGWHGDFHLVADIGGVVVGAP